MVPAGRMSPWGPAQPPQAFPSFAPAKGLACAVLGGDTGISFPVEKWVHWQSQMRCEPTVPLRSC